MGRGQKRRKLFTVSIPVRSEEEEKTILIWSEYVRLSNKEKGRAILELIQREVEGVMNSDKALYEALKLLAEKRMEEGHGTEAGDD